MPTFDPDDVVQHPRRNRANSIGGRMDTVRLHADALESEVADGYWTLPK